MRSVPGGLLSTAAEGRVQRPMRVMRLLPKSSRLRPSPTDDYSDQTSESDAHGGGHGDHWPSHNERASKVEPQVSDRSSLLQIVDRDREQRPAQETPATDRVGDRQSDTRKPSAQDRGHSSKADDRNEEVEDREPSVVLHQAEPPSEAQQPSNHYSGGESHDELHSIPSVAKVAHASRVGRVKRDPAFRTTTWDLIPQRLHATSATEVTGVHVARTCNLGDRKFVIRIDHCES